MITIFLPEELMAGGQQGSLSGIFEAHRSEPRRHAVLVVTTLQYRLPDSRSLGYLVGADDSKQGFSGAAFAHRPNFVVLASGVVPRVLRCVVGGAPVPPELVTLALYSPAAVRGADLLRAQLAAPPPGWDPLHLMVRGVQAESVTAAAGVPPAGQPRVPFAVGWLQWLVLELCSLVLLGPPWWRPGAGGVLRVGWLQWALLELALLLRVSQLHRLLVWLRVDVSRISRSLLAVPLRCSALLAQCLLRVSQVAHLAMQRGRSVVWLSCACALVCDVAVGALLTRRLQREVSAAALLRACTDGTAAAVSQLQTLLQWMMGAPAGLKLNTPLTTALGSFFLYHVHLWGAFVTLAAPSMIACIQLLLPLGYLGASFLFSLMADLLSLATFHVYCVYVYATKVYQLEVRWMVRLWRLFRGRRWNAEKQRVEAWPYTTEQLFLGTLSFTVLLFLFPTVLLYYSVFLMLRLSVLAAVSLLTCLTYLANVNPVFVLASWLVRAQSVAGSVHVTVVRDEPGSTVTRVRVTPAPLRQTLGWFWCPVDPGLRAVRWSQLLAALVRGNLVYPV